MKMKESTWSKLVTTEVTVCDYCWQEEGVGDDPDVSWISRSNCGVWIHSSCVHCNSSKFKSQEFWTIYVQGKFRIVKHLLLFIKGKTELPRICTKL